MTDDLDDELRRALRPVAPREGFTDRVMARLAAAQPPKARVRWRIPAAFAAAVLLGLGIYARVEQQRQNIAGLEARRQVIEALRLTDQKLDLAYQTVKEASGS
jgi:hypothetical protein